jgi:hypothetical protein
MAARLMMLAKGCESVRWRERGDESSQGNQDIDAESDLFSSERGATAGIGGGVLPAFQQQRHGVGQKVIPAGLRATP